MMEQRWLQQQLTSCGHRERCKPLFLLTVELRVTMIDDVVAPLAVAQSKMRL
jgi:hypothetical protein